MKLPFKIVLINVALALIFGLLFSGMTENFISMFGLVSLVGGIVDIIVGLFLLLMKDKRYAQGFLLSGGVLMILGFITCGSTGLKV